MLRRDGLSEGLGESLVSLSLGGCWIATTGESESTVSARGGNIGLSTVIDDCSLLAFWGPSR
jgi:hypothetical protein